MSGAAALAHDDYEARAAASADSAAAQKITAVADKFRPRMARATLNVFEEARARVDVTALILLLASADRDTVAAFMERPDLSLRDPLLRSAEDVPSNPLAGVSLDIAASAADATQCSYGGPVPKAKAKSGNVTQAQIDDLYQQYKSGVKKAKIQTDFGLTSSQLTTIIYKKEVDLFPVEKLASIWNDFKAGKTTKELQTAYDLTQSQVQMVVSKVKTGSQAIKQAILAQPASVALPAAVAPAAPAPELAKVVVPKPAGAKTAVWDPAHASKKPFEQFWLEKKQFHGFTDAEIAWNTQIPEEFLYKIYEKGAQQQLTYVAPKVAPAPYKAPYKAAPKPKPAAVPYDYSKVKQTPAGEWPVSPDVVRTKGSSYPTEVTNAFKAWEATLTAEEKHAIEYYTGSGYMDLNPELRRVGITANNKKAQLIQQSLERAEALGPPPPPELVWRGLANSGSREFVSKLASGDVITLDGFQSTSIDPQRAVSWASGNTVFEIKPTKGAWVKPLSSHAREDEFLLPHGAKYKVRGQQIIKVHGYAGRIEEKAVIQLEMLP